MHRIPLATYRLQLHEGFTFDAAAEIADYLKALGVSHVYSSPYLQAAPHSMHGYDVVDYHRVNEELGGSEAHDRYSMRLGECGLGQVLDIVPNHMAISGRRNRLWWDVLENGPASRYAMYFDVDWNSPEEKLRNKTLMPILGDHYGRVLTRGEIRVKRHGGEFAVHYFDHSAPVAPESTASVIGKAAEESGSDYLAFLADSLRTLPSCASDSRECMEARHRDKEVIRTLIERLCNEVPFIAEGIDKVVDSVNRNPDALHDLLEHQNYRLAYWRTAEQELGYRRFFDVNNLIGLHTENERVFADTHALILTWLREGVLDGVRIDHPDGLRDPRQYFDRLRNAAPDVWIVGEKILEPGERLRDDWPIDGTTGYDFMSMVNGLFVDSREEAAFNRIYSQFTNRPTDYAAVCRDKKLLIIRDLLGSDVNRLTALFAQVCDAHRDRRDFTRHDIRHAIREVAASFPVYRTYVVPERNEISEDDRKYIAEAIESAKRNRQDLDSELFDFLGDVLTVRVQGKLETEFVMRFQQFTSPVMAKGVEDTVFYFYNRLTSLNEVGGDPSRFGIADPNEFHAFCIANRRRYPSTMLSTSTHDTKRSEDVRARIDLLSEIPKQWERALNRWARANHKYKTDAMPGRNTEYLLYQTMIGAWPIPADRLSPYIEKATREAKDLTTWLDPNEAFEDATKQFIEAIYGDGEFLADFEKFVTPLIQPGRVNSLAQVLLKLTAPGVPDLYQGSELWDLSLVDPDNRRPVDYSVRRNLLEELPRLTVADVLKRADEGLPKLWLIHNALRVRRENPEAFGPEGKYSPIEVKGAKAGHALGFLRGDRIVVIIPRLVLKANSNWIDTAVELPEGQWRNALTGAILSGGTSRLRQVFAEFPVALLIRQ
ncbi:MAG TPA: malto-oligosyltrehalose synthase [Bryobacteraceae bacterium]|jgi:(1->4)-alpha-D-glucan 1-alpha-D-glucosylmutase|nr:malto-oligosyltrehalose synthase [Bryobacteraceae bacterium]